MTHDPMAKAPVISNCDVNCPKCLFVQQGVPGKDVDFRIKADSEFGECVPVTVASIGGHVLLS